MYQVPTGPPVGINKYFFCYHLHVEKAGVLLTAFNYQRGRVLLACATSHSEVFNHNHAINYIDLIH